MLTLKNFEKQVGETMLKRGKQYYDDGAVTDMEETGENRWKAEVEGSETYTVEVTLKNNNSISEYFCDCPYDGSICKHAVAVFFAIREEVNNHKRKEANTSGKTAFKNILLKINLKEYQEFMLQHAAKDKNFMTEFELWFADKDERIDVGKKYTDLVQKLIKKHTVSGYVDYRATKSLSNEVGKLIDTGYDFVKKKNFKDAFVLAKPVLKEMIEVFTYYDDSNGELGGTMDKIIRLIDAIADAKETAPELKEQVFDFLQTELGNKQYFSLGDFGDELFAVFQKLAVQLNKPEEFLRFVDARLAKLTGEYDDYRKKFFLAEKMAFLKTIGRKDEAEKLVQQNMDIVEIRQKEVRKAVDKKDFITAKKLIQEGIKIAKGKDHPGTVSQWEKELMHIAVLEKDKETIRYYAKHFAFDRGFSREYYLQWKKTYPAAEWKDVIEQYIQEEIKKTTKENKQKKGWHFSNSSLLYSLAPVYIQEKYWDRLLALVKTANNLETTLEYHEYLVKAYPSELLELYLPALERAGDKASTRSEYAALVFTMQKIMKDIPEGKEKIRAVALNLKQKNPRRPAMIEELNKIL